MRPLDIVTCERHHLRAIDVQAAQRAEYHADEVIDQQLGEAYTILDGDEILACFGLCRIYRGRGLAWAVLSKDCGRRMVGVTRAIRCLLDATSCRRVEMAVADGFAAGERWARILGFECETPTALRAYLPGATDARLFSRITAE
jgi:hypothetical protein